MILIISTIICVVIIAVAIYNKDSTWLIFLKLPILLGYGLMGIGVTVDTKTEYRVISSICSEKLGECKLIIENTVYNVSDYKVVDWFTKNSSPTYYKFIIKLNSYGYNTDMDIQLPNGHVYNINKNI